jgi:hypothetical protein
MTTQEVEALDYFLGWRNLSPSKLVERLNLAGFTFTSEDTLRTILDGVVTKHADLTKAPEQP